MKINWNGIIIEKISLCSIPFVTFTQDSNFQLIFINKKILVSILPTKPLRSTSLGYFFSYLLIINYVGNFPITPMKININHDTYGIFLIFNKILNLFGFILSNGQVGFIQPKFQV